MAQCHPFAENQNLSFLLQQNSFCDVCDRNPDSFKEKSIFLKRCPQKHQPPYIPLKRRCSLRGCYLYATLCWAGSMFWNVLLMIYSKIPTSASEWIQMLPANVYKFAFCSYRIYINQRNIYGTDNTYFVLFSAPHVHQDLKIPKAKPHLNLFLKSRL